MALVRQAGSNLPKVGRYNRAVVLDRIQLADGISRAEIAEHTGLTPQTVSGIVRKLLDDGIVREDGSSRVAELGKPRTTLRINGDAGSAVGLHFDPVELTGVVVDLVGQPRVLQRRPTPRGARPDEVVAAMADLAADVLAEADVPRDRVLGLGVATPGPIDQDSGMVVAPPKLSNWYRVPMKQLLSDATGLPVTLDNDATAAAIGERWSGVGRGVANFAYFFFGTGIGGGLILGHQVHRGGSLNAGEFGHTSVRLDGPQCYCGNNGCLELLASPAAIVAETQRRLADGEASTLNLEALDHKAIRSAAASGDRLATAVVAESAELVAAVAVTVVGVADVDLIVLGGHGIEQVEPIYLDAVTEALATRPLSRHVRVADAAVSPLGSDAAVIGAASLVLHATYSPQLSALLEA